ncbi:MAG: hypothetical protein ACE5FT_01415, partial [Candidatus Nanoarchaeia archaeon]
MKPFDEYIEDGIIKSQSPDLPRAKALRQESEQSERILKEIIEKIGITDENANYIIKNTYDIIMELIRASMLLKGYNAAGRGAHEAEVAYLAALGFGEKDIEFADKLRYFRNGILYYGKSFDAEYATKVIEYMEKIKK